MAPNDVSVCDRRLMAEPVQVVDAALTPEERHMLILGLTDWGGPVTATDQLAVRMGFANRDDLSEAGEHLAKAIAAGEPLSVEDWTRALVATEAAFAMEGDEWTSNNGGPPEYWSNLLLRLEARVPKSDTYEFELFQETATLPPDSSGDFQPEPGSHWEVRAQGGEGSN